MSIFTLHAQVLADYRDFVRSFFIVADAKGASSFGALRWRKPICGRIFFCKSVPRMPDRQLSMNWPHAPSCTRRPPPSLRTPDAKPFHLYQHQIEALAKARAGQSFVVTSGTGSGKSLTYFLPIIEALARQPATGDRVAALVVYPMNALVNSQLQDAGKTEGRLRASHGPPFPGILCQVHRRDNRIRARRTPPAPAPDSLDQLRHGRAVARSP